MPDWLGEILKQSPLGVLVAMFWITFRYITQQHKSEIRSKELEIDRLVAEKNKLQEIVLTRRLSTTDPHPGGETPP